MHTQHNPCWINQPMPTEEKCGKGGERTKEKEKERQMEIKR